MMYYINLSEIQKSYPIPLKYHGISDIHVMTMGQLRSNGLFKFAKYNNALNIHFVYSGRGLLMVDEQRFEITANDVFILFPGTQTFYYDFKDSPWRYDWFTIMIPSEHQALDHLLITRTNPVMKLAESSPILDQVKGIASILKSGQYPALYPVRAAWELLELFYQPDPIMAMDIADQIKSHIDNAEKPVRVNEIADHFSVDRSTIYRLFKDKFAMPVKDYIDERKFQKTCQLLKNSDYSISAIGEYCGFDSPHYFSRAFRQRFGKSPSEWRLSNRSKKILI